MLTIFLDVFDGGERKVTKYIKYESDRMSSFPFIKRNANFAKRLELLTSVCAHLRISIQRAHHSFHQCKFFVSEPFFVFINVRLLNNATVMIDCKIGI